jgi:transcriptional regulator with XRE-family HTH domain
MKNRIAEIIEKEKLTSLKFADLIGIQPSAVSHILKGRNNPSTEVLQKILNTFRTISSDWLLLGVGSMYRETGETSKKQPFNVKVTSNRPQMGSLFDNEPENDTEYHKENESTTTRNFQSSQNQSASTASERQTTTTVTENKNPENKYRETETKATLPKRIVKRIIIYYSDNTFEEYNMLLNKEE